MKEDFENVVGGALEGSDNDLLDCRGKFARWKVGTLVGVNWVLEKDLGRPKGVNVSWDI